jgi:hypothetical protein
VPDESNPVPASQPPPAAKPPTSPPIPAPEQAEGSKPPEPVTAAESGEDDAKSRGFIFDLFDEMSNAAFVHFRLIRKIQRVTKRKLITYCGLFAHPGGIIMNEDAESIESILRSCDMSKFEGLDLMVHSPGGMPEAAGDIIRVCRTYSTSFRVIIPNMAMSAGTLLAMGSDVIMMSDTSKLGPIDPQMVYQTKEGAFMRAAQSFIQAFGSLVAEANKLAASGQSITAHLHLLTKQDPSWIVECVRARNATVKLACRVLKNGMLKHETDAVIEKVANDFLAKGDEESHGRRITPDEASRMGLNIEKVERDCAIWKDIWELYVRTDHYTKSKGLGKYMASEAGGLEMQVRQIGLGGA